MLVAKKKKEKPGVTVNWRAGEKERECAKGRKRGEERRTRSGAKQKTFFFWKKSNRGCKSSESIEAFGETTTRAVFHKSIYTYPFFNLVIVINIQSLTL